MDLADFVKLPPPAPWRDGDNIPWHEPAFSERMLQEHLSQAHDAASRRSEIIDEQVAWIHDQLLGGRHGRVLDLSCGPGLYCERLARLGHECTGIDYSPSSIAHAKETARQQGLSCEYRLEDMRKGTYGSEFDLALLLYGELNVFRREDAKAILAGVAASLREGGALLLEPHTFEAVQAKGKGRRWSSSGSGLFSERPHVLLQEHAWDGTSETATVRYAVIDAASADVTVYAQTFQAYSEDGYRELLVEAGFKKVGITPAFGGSRDDGLIAIAARA